AALSAADLRHGLAAIVIRATAESWSLTAVGRSRNRGIADLACRLSDRGAGRDESNRGADNKYPAVHGNSPIAARISEVTTLTLPAARPAAVGTTIFATRGVPPDLQGPLLPPCRRHSLP